MRPGRPLQYFIHNDFDALRMEVSGCLVGAAAKDAYEAWRTASSMTRQRRRVIDLSFVTEADENGRVALRAWQEQGAQVLAPDFPLQSSLLSRSTAGNPASAEASPLRSAYAQHKNAETAWLSIDGRMECGVR
jgi:hypothetical protein